jgi:hypothetical protein
VPAANVSGAELVERKTKSGEARDEHKYAFVRVVDGEIPGVAPATYLVDPATNEAKYVREDGIGAGRLQAPQAKLMSVVIDGLLTHKLPWDLILIGAAIAIFIEMMGFRSLTFAVGVYLPLSSTMPVFLGGLVRAIADKVYKRTPDAEDEPEGTLWGSGLIAGASIVGIAAAMLGFLPGFDSDNGYHPAVAKLREWFPVMSGSLQNPTEGQAMIGDLGATALLALLCWLMFRAARKPAESA